MFKWKWVILQQEKFQIAEVGVYSKGQHKENDQPCFQNIPWVSGCDSIKANDRYVAKIYQQAFKNPRQHGFSLFEDGGASHKKKIH